MISVVDKIKKIDIRVKELIVIVAVTMFAFLVLHTVAFSRIDGLRRKQTADVSYLIGSILNVIEIVGQQGTVLSGDIQQVQRLATRGLMHKEVDQVADKKLESFASRVEAKHLQLELQLMELFTTVYTLHAQDIPRSHAKRDALKTQVAQLSKAFANHTTWTPTELRDVAYQLDTFEPQAVVYSARTMTWEQLVVIMATSTALSVATTISVASCIWCRFAAR